METPLDGNVISLTCTRSLIVEFSLKQISFLAKEAKGLIYKFIENPLSKKDNEWLINK